MRYELISHQALNFWQNWGIVRQKAGAPCLIKPSAAAGHMIGGTAVMDSKKLRILLKAVDAGSMMKVAEQNGYTPSGLTHMMTALERELGIRLLTRNSHGVALTPDGQRLLPLLKRYLSAEDKIYSEIAQIKKHNDACIRIGAYPSIAKVWMPGIIQEFLKRCPEADLELTTLIRPEAYQALEAGTVDVIFAGEDSGSGFPFIQLKEDPYYLIFPAELAYRLKGRPFPIEDLADYPFIMPAYRADTEVTQMLAQHGITPRSLAVIADYQVIVNMVSKGLGLSIVSGLTLESSAQAVQFTLISPHMCRKLGIATRPIKELSPIKREFIAFVREKRL